MDYLNTGEARCALCGTAAGTSPCAACRELDYRDAIRAHCTRTRSTSPLDIARTIMSHPRFPLAGQAHHPLVAAALVTAWGNATGADAGARLDAAIEKADSIPGGFCAGFGADAAAIACGIAVSTIEGTTIKAEHAAGRSRAHGLTGQAMLHIASGTGNRCCKRSVYGVLEVATAYFDAVLGVPLAPSSAPIACPFVDRNKLCNRERCRYHPAGASGHAERARLVVVP
ncbi:DUF5714 domain-containing protein [Anaeromyxobacter terrae]|uniref:DUF5714 domain-containing protein n=1 Tax=Anaeromyxobacter terrae TaxID=2925406 RepID=UPI001F581193|nr:DUF5714 domain-containing protein [Anaeromyxobacter sp. SG22]